MQREQIAFCGKLCGHHAGPDGVADRALALAVHVACAEEIHRLHQYVCDFGNDPASADEVSS